MSVASPSTTHARHFKSPSHGNPRSVPSAAMDMDRDACESAEGSRQRSPPVTSQLKSSDAMDTALDGHSDRSTQIRIPGLHVTAEGIKTQSPTPHISEPIAHGQIGVGGGGRLQEVFSAPLRSNPAITGNTLSLYRLDSLVSTVARTDPVTGEKINKMRKSYEGQLKMLGLSGRNKAVRHDDTKKMGLAEMAAWPEDEWQNQKAMGKDVVKGLSDVAKGKLSKAMQMQAGRIPNNDYWEDLLGIVAEKNKSKDPNTMNAKPTALGKTTGQQPNGSRLSGGAAAAVAGNTTTGTAQTQSEHIRARRNTKKRRYDDGSFEGYGEGYVDDDADMGYSSGESRGTRTSAGNRKRRKTKVRSPSDDNALAPDTEDLLTGLTVQDYTNSPSEFPTRNNSFTAGPMGISAYGR